MTAGVRSSRRQRYANPAECFRGVIPDAVQRETVHRRAGIILNTGALCDPVSAQRHFMPQRARDNGTADSEALNRIWYDSLPLAMDRKIRLMPQQRHNER